MPWVVATQKDGATFGVEGGAAWSDPNGVSTTIQLPTGVSAFSDMPSWDVYGENAFGVGAWTENIVMTREWAIWQQGIRPPVLVPDVAVSAGPGITDDVICYLAWYDENTDEWSGLSAPSATLSPANQKITWSNLPSPVNPRVTHIGLWRSVAGSLPRLIMKVQKGQTTITEAATVAELGEAWTEDFELFPRCRYNVVWHDRQFMAGDDDNPNSIYCSLIGYPERRSSIELNTKTRQPVIGLAIVRDTLLVICPRATERISGWTADDIGIEIAQPQIGGLSHQGIVNIQGFLWIPTHMGVFITDGSGWYPMMTDVWTKWVAEYDTHKAAYEKSWAVHDPISGVYKLYVGTHTDTPGYTFWVAGYRPVIPLLGGGMAQPDWSYDVSTRAYTCGALMGLPGGRKQDVYHGGNAAVWKTNILTPGAAYQDDGGDTLAKQLRLVGGADFYLDVGGDLIHGKRFTEIEMFVVSERNAWEFNLYGGDEHRVVPLADMYGAAGTATAPSFASGTIPASATYLTIAGHNYHAEPKTVHPFALPQVVGRSLTWEVKASKPDAMDFRGFQVEWKSGPAPRMQVYDEPLG